MNRTQQIFQGICNHTALKRSHLMTVCLLLLLVVLASTAVFPTAAQDAEIPSNITDGTYFDLEGTTPDPLINSTTLEFLPLEAQVGTPNGNGWRHEYKIDESLRQPLGAHYERFEATYTVSMSDAAKSIIVQYHGDSPTLMKMYYADTVESGLIDSVGGNGIFDLYVRLRTLGLPDFGEDVFAFGTLQAGDTFTVVVENNYGTVTVSAMGQSITRELVQTSADYLKFGNYLQAQYTTDATHPYGGEKCRDLDIAFQECYDTLGITESSVLMTNVSYERIEDTTFEPPAPVPNATLLNGDFEAGLDDWSQTEPASESGDVNGGLISAKVGTDGRVSQFVDLEPNTEYQFDVYVKGEGTAGITNGGDVAVVEAFDESDWTLVSTTFTTGADPDAAEVFGASGTSGDVRFDDFALTALATVVVDPPTTSSSVVVNGDFESEMSGWTQLEPVAESGDTNGGIVSAKVGTDGRVSQMIDLEPNTEYQFDVYVKGEGTAGVTNGGDVDVAEAFDHSDWTLVSTTFTTGANPDPVELFGAAGTSGDVRFDDFALYPVSGAPAVTATPSTPDPTTVAPTPQPTPSDGSCLPIPEQIVDEVVWDLEGGDLPLHPLVDSCTLAFLPLDAQHTTPNGNGWRHEYKIKSDLRVAMTEVYEEFGATIRVDMSDGGKTIVAQHHASDTGTIMKLYVADSDETGFDDGANTIASDGIFNVYVRILNESGNEEKQWLGNIVSGETFSFHVLNDFGYVEVSAFDKSFGIDVEDSSASYLKFGNYLQSQTPEGDNCGTKGDSDSFAQCYADIGITESAVIMTDVTYVRTTSTPTDPVTPLAVGSQLSETAQSSTLLYVVIGALISSSLIIAVLRKDNQ